MKSIGIKKIGMICLLFVSLFSGFSESVISSTAPFAPLPSRPFGIASSQEGGPMVTVLCYHHVNCGSAGDYSVTEEQLSAQIDALLGAGFSFISSSQLDAFYSTGTPIPEKSALITFDDGNYDVYEYAWPLLKKRGIPFTFFVYPSIIRLGHARHCVNWDDLRAMAADELVTIGSHTYDHPFLTKPPADVTDRAKYDKWLQREIVESKAVIESRVGKPVTELAVPFGAYDQYVRDKIRSAGYELAFSVSGANSDIRADRWSVNRIIVTGKMSIPYFLDLATALPLYFVTYAPTDLARVSGENTVISFKLDDAEYLDETTIKSKLTSFPGLALRHLPDVDQYSETVSLSKDKFYEVYVWGKDKQGRNCRTSWLFMYDREMPNFLREEGLPPAPVGIPAATPLPVSAPVPAASTAAAPAREIPKD